MALKISAYYTIKYYRYKEAGSVKRTSTASILTLIELWDFSLCSQFLVSSTQFGPSPECQMDPWRRTVQYSRKYLTQSLFFYTCILFWSLLTYSHTYKVCKQRTDYTENVNLNLPQFDTQMRTHTCTRTHVRTHMHTHAHTHTHTFYTFEDLALI